MEMLEKLRADTNIDVDLKIISSDGKMINNQIKNLNTGSNNIQIDASNLANGYYFLSIINTTNRNKIISHNRVIIQH